jgi:hypothetical protein
MKYTTEPTSKGNIGVSTVSQAKADAQAKALDANGCRYCTNCEDCEDCTDCTGCTGCVDCTDCTKCKHCNGCTNLTSASYYRFNQPLPTVEPTLQMQRLDRVRDIILANPSRLGMGSWHEGMDWKKHSLDHEIHQCATTHCMAGWLQVLGDSEIRGMSPERAGATMAPIAMHMFHSGNEAATQWLLDREYIKELGVVE